MSVRQWRGKGILPIVDDEGSNFFCRAAKANVSQVMSSVKRILAMLHPLASAPGGRTRCLVAGARTLHCD